MLKSIMLLAALTVSGSAFAEEVIIDRDAPVVEERVPSTSRTTVEHHDRECDSKSVHTENDLGDSKTVTREECD